jgi:hypothetical protein
MFIIFETSFDWFNTKREEEGRRERDSVEKNMDKDLNAINTKR